MSIDSYMGAVLLLVQARSVITLSLTHVGDPPVHYLHTSGAVQCSKLTVHIFAAGRTFFAHVRPMCARFSPNCHSYIPEECTENSRVHSFKMNTQTKRLISNTAVVYHPAGCGFTGSCTVLSTGI